jgi:hypothetical protein
MFEGCCLCKKLTNEGVRDSKSGCKIYFNFQTSAQRSQQNTNHGAKKREHSKYMNENLFNQA